MFVNRNFGRVTRISVAVVIAALNAPKLRMLDYLITGNQRHFPNRWKKTKVIGAPELIELLMEQEE